MDDIDKSWKMIIVIAIVILLVFFLYVAIYNSFYLKDDVAESNITIYNIDEIDVNFGAMNARGMLSNYDNGSAIGGLNQTECRQRGLIFKDNICQCRTGMYGPYCLQQAHAADYYYIGSSEWQYSATDLDREVNLSFKDGALDENSCTSICNRTEGCNGIKYNNNTKVCSLLNNTPISDSDIKIDVLADDKIYMKRMSKPIVNKVIAYSGRTPLRYYMNRRSRFVRKRRGVPGTRRISRYGVITMEKNIVYHINWRIHRIVNNTGLIGVYSSMPFQGNDIYNIMGNAVFIDTTEGNNAVPRQLYRLEECWVMYISREEFSQNIPNSALITNQN